MGTSRFEALSEHVTHGAASRCPPRPPLPVARRLCLLDKDMRDSQAHCMEEDPAMAFGSRGDPVAAVMTSETSSSHFCASACLHRPIDPAFRTLDLIFGFLNEFSGLKISSGRVRIVKNEMSKLANEGHTPR